MNRVNFNSEEEVKEYLHNLETEYNYQCHREKTGEGRQKMQRSSTDIHSSAARWRLDPGRVSSAHGALNRSLGWDGGWGLPKLGQVLSCTYTTVAYRYKMVGYTLEKGPHFLYGYIVVLRQPTVTKWLVTLQQRKDHTFFTVTLLLLVVVTLNLVSKKLYFSKLSRPKTKV